MIYGFLFPTRIAKYVVVRFLCQITETFGQVLAFQLVTPTDFVLYKGFFDVRVGNHNDESFLNLSNHERSSNVGDPCVPLTPESPLLHKTRGPHFPPSPLLSESGALWLIRLASPPLLDAEYPHPYTVDDQVSHLTIYVSSNEVAPEFTISTLDIEESLMFSESLSLPRMVSMYSRINGQSRYMRSNQGISEADTCFAL